MSLTNRMAAIVGDENSVGRYLAEKVGHTALITWACVGIFATDLLWTAIGAALGYNLIGKALWLYGRSKTGWIREDGHSRVTWSVEWRDTVFDTWVGLVVAVLAVPQYLPWAGAAVVAAVWLVGFLVLDNNAWGSPS